MYQSAITYWNRKFYFISNMISNENSRILCGFAQDYVKADIDRSKCSYLEVIKVRDVPTVILAM